MARIVGKPGRYGMEHEAQILQKQLLIGMFLIMGIGIALGASFRFIGSWVAWALFVVELGLLWYGKRLFARLDACRKAWSSGAEGEREVADALAKLPDCYCVIHDISTNYGNLDHVVVDPKGVFAIETKRWKGAVSADGNGGLLLNGKQPSKDPVKSLTGAIMRIKERLIPLTQISDVYIQGLTVEDPQGEEFSAVIEAEDDAGVDDEEDSAQARPLNFISGKSGELEVRPVVQSGNLSPRRIVEGIFNNATLENKSFPSNQVNETMSAPAQETE